MLNILLIGVVYDFDIVALKSPGVNYFIYFLNCSLSFNCLGVFWKLHGIVENILLQLKRAITLKNLLMNQLTFYSRKQSKSATPFCTDITYLFFKACLLNSFRRACVTSNFDCNRTLPSKRIIFHVHAQ